jgi:hypothetical protein
MGKMEDRAREFCQHIRDMGTGTITIRYVRSKSYGRTPVIDNGRGERMAQAIGCNYEKKGAVLSHVARFLFDDGSDDQREIRWASHAGAQHILGLLQEKGWDYQWVADLPDADVYLFTRRTEEVPVPSDPIFEEPATNIRVL